MSEELSITDRTKVAALLDHYPELEDVLIGMAPPFKKLRNPILRRSVAKVASLRQAAAVGGLPVHEMVNSLRAAAGQPPLDAKTFGEQVSYFEAQPDWFDDTKIVDSIDEQTSDPDVMPLNPLIRRATKMRQGEILELVTTFVPAPGIDIMKSKGFSVWSVEEGGFVRTFISKPGPDVRRT